MKVLAWKSVPWILFGALVLAGPPLVRPARGAALPAQDNSLTLENENLRAEFNDRGLISLTGVKTARKVVFSADPTSLTIAGTKIAVDTLGLAEMETKPARLGVPEQAGRPDLGRERRFPRR